MRLPGRKRKKLTLKLQDVEKNYDFYQSIYRDYVADFLKIAAYIRQMVYKPKLRRILEDKHSDKLAFFRQIISESEGKAVKA